MNKKNILIPLDESKRSLHSIDFVKSFFSSDSVNITLMHVKDLVVINSFSYENEIDTAAKNGERVLDRAKFLLKDYQVETFFTFGHPSKEILAKAEQDNIDIIVMTKSTKKGLTRIIGSVTSAVVKDSECVVMIVPQ